MSKNLHATGRGAQPDIYRTKHDIVGRWLGMWLGVFGTLLLGYFYIGTPEGTALIHEVLLGSVQTVIIWAVALAGAGSLVLAAYYLVCVALDRERVYETPSKEQSLTGIDLTMFTAQRHSDGTAIVLRTAIACGTVGSIGAGFAYYGYLHTNNALILNSVSVALVAITVIFGYGVTLLSKTHRRHNSDHFATFLVRNRIRQLPPGQHPAHRTDIRAGDSEFIRTLDDARVESAITGTYKGQTYTLSVLDVSGFGRSSKWLTMAKLPISSNYQPKDEVSLRTQLHAQGVATIERSDTALYLFWHNGIEYSQPGLVALYEPITTAVAALRRNTPKSTA